MSSPLLECRLHVHIFITYLIVLQILFFNWDRLRTLYGATISFWFLAVIQIPGTCFFFPNPYPPSHPSYLPGRRSKRPGTRTCGCIMVSTTTRHSGWLAPLPHGIWAGVNSQKAAYHHILVGWFMQVYCADNERNPQSKASARALCLPMDKEN